MVSAIIRTIFGQLSYEAAKSQLQRVVNELSERFPKAMEILKASEEDVLAYMTFPIAKIVFRSR
jgi:Transposase, Mutator family.